MASRGTRINTRKLLKITTRTIFYLRNIQTRVFGFAFKRYVFTKLFKNPDKLSSELVVSYISILNDVNS